MTDVIRSSSQNASPALSKQGDKSPTNSQTKETDLQPRASLSAKLVSRDGDTNPFRMPPDKDIFLQHDRDKQRKLKQRLEQRKLKIWQKTTATSMDGKSGSRLKSESGIEELEAEDEKTLTEKHDQEFTIAITRNRYSDKEPLNDYINKKREMFLVQYSLGVKRDEMRKLEEIAVAEERKLELAEQYLEEDAALFDEFLKENDRNASDAIKIADAETRAKLEKIAEIKRINAQMMSIKSEISKHEDILKEYQLYKRFLTSVTPKDWLNERALERQSKKELKYKNVRRRSSKAESTSDVSSELPGSSVRSSKNRSVKNQTPPVKVLTSQSQASVNENNVPATDSDDEELELYFTDPQQLLDIFAELEEQNLSLIQNSQETEEALEEMKQTVKNTQAKMEKETDILKEQIEKLNNAILKEEEKAVDLEEKARMFSFGEFKADDQEKMLAVLNKKVEEVYQSCIGENEASLSTLQMLTNIENRLEELFEQIEMLPADKVEAAEKAKEKERRMRIREEKLELQRQQQEERLRRAMERAKAEPKKKN